MAGDWCGNVRQTLGQTLGGVRRRRQLRVLRIPSLGEIIHVGRFTYTAIWPSVQVVGTLYKLSAVRDDETLGLAVAALGNVRRRSATFGRDLVGVARDDGTLGRPELTFGRRSATFGRIFV